MKNIFLLLVFSLSLFATSTAIVPKVYDPVVDLRLASTCGIVSASSHIVDYSGNGIDPVQVWVTSDCKHVTYSILGGYRAYSVLPNSTFTVPRGAGYGKNIVFTNTVTYSPCPSGQVRNSSGECVVNCSFTPPPTLQGYPFLKHFNSSDVAVKYFKDNNIQNGYIQSANSLGAPSSCTGFYAYGQLPKNDPCKAIDVPLIVNGFPLQKTFIDFSSCSSYIKNYIGNGICKQFNKCSKIFAYYKSDNNSSFIPDINNTLPLDSNFTSNNDLNYTAPNVVDNNNSNSSFNLNPLLLQLSQLSIKQHTDIRNVANKLDTTNNQLSNIGSKIDTTNNKLSSIDNKLSSLNGDNFLGDLSFTSITDFYSNVKSDLSSIDTQYSDFKNVINGGFTNYSLPTGQAPVFTATVFGKPLTLSLCSSFSTFRPFVFFIFSAVFLFLAIRIFWLGVKL